MSLEPLIAPEIKTCSDGDGDTESTLQGLLLEKSGTI